MATEITAGQTRLWTSVPEPVATLLAQYNTHWNQRLAQLQRQQAPPLWMPTVSVDARMRQRFEQALPIREFLRHLRRLALMLLPSAAWLPAPLAAAIGQDTHAPESPPLAVASLPDLWHILPPAFAGRVSFNPEELLPLFCALADPPRFGTDFGRYPEQLAYLAEWAPQFIPAGRAPIVLLDIGCGTGQGTWEAAETVAASTPRPVFALGLTREPLEAWMATNRCLPHDPGRQSAYQALRPAPSAGPPLIVSFMAGDALALPLPDGSVDLALANGLVGGPCLAAESHVVRVLRSVQNLLNLQGILLCASHFHNGYTPALDRFATWARLAGWDVHGTPRDARLHRT